MSDFKRICRKTGKPLEDWQAEIVVRDSSAASCLQSYLADLMYPDITMASDREARLMAEGGEFMARVIGKANAKAASLRTEYPYA